MSTINKERIESLAREIIAEVRKLQPKHPQIMQLVKSHCIACYGRALQQITAEPDANSEAHVEQLLGILKTGDMSKLNGKAPAGQALATPPPAPEAPAPAPVNRLNPADDEPAPAPIEIDVPTPTPAVAPTPTPVLAQHTPESNGKESALVAALLDIIDKRAAAKAAPIDESRIREIVREEVGKVFGALQLVLQPKS